MIFENVVPVSYTHLDVYKRQHLYLFKTTKIRTTEHIEEYFPMKLLKKSECTGY